MTAVAHEEQRRGVWWWITAILAPIGVLAGPIAIAKMLSGLIEWGGPFGFAVAYWEEFVAVHFRTVFGWLAGLVSLPPPPEWLSDYLTIGILLTSSLFRAIALTPNADDPGKRLSAYDWISLLSYTLFFWPLALLHTIQALFEEILYGDTRPIWSRNFLTFAPFLIFLFMFVINQIYYVG